MILRGSEYQDFLMCRKKWFHAWVEKIEPKRPDNKLFFGNVFHKWLEEYYKHGCDKDVADIAATVWINKQNTSGMESHELDEVFHMTSEIAKNYHETYGGNDKTWKVLATELEFLVKLEGDIFYTGTIDLVVEHDGLIIFSDHKTVSSLSMYEEKSKMDRQISRYWWALKMVAAGVGRIKDKETGMWVTWTELKDKEIAGFIYNLIAKDFPKEPKVLKKGDLSKDKSQKTTFKKYQAKIQELGLDDSEYEDILALLRDKPDPFLKRVNVLRGESELESAMWEFMYTSGDLHDVKLMVTEKPEMVDMLTYRNIGTHCDSMCGYKALCQTTIEGGNISLTKNLAYRQKEEVK
jgi:hypothetical protein